MFRRRDLLKTAGMATAAALISRRSFAEQIACGEDAVLQFQTGSMDLQLSGVAPEFLRLNIDCLGKGRRGAAGHSPDWRRCDGMAMGYEGLLTDNYYALLAVPLRRTETRWRDRLRPASALT